MGLQLVVLAFALLLPAFAGAQDAIRYYPPPVPGPQGPPGTAPFLKVTDYGATGDGSTDDSTAVLDTITAVTAAGGGTVFFPAGTYRIDSQIVFANNGATPAHQKPIKLLGEGASMSGEGGPIYGGTVLDLRYAGTIGKIKTLALGLLEIEGMTLTDTVGGSLPFVYTTNTTLHIRHTAFIGTKTATNCDQDAIVLGGTSTVYGGLDPDGGFQGYGTVIADNYADHIRRFVYLRTSANAVQIRDNTIWTNSGSNLAGGAAIELLGVGSGYSVGNVIAGNLIEVGNYPYGVKADYAVRNSFIANNFYDSTATTLAMYRMEAQATYNLLIDGFKDGPKTLLSEHATSAQSTTVITSEQGGWTSFPRIRSDGYFWITDPITGKFSVTTQTGKLTVFNDTATTGVTSAYIKAGEGQAATPIFSVNAFNDTQLFWVGGTFTYSPNMIYSGATVRTDTAFNYNGTNGLTVAKTVKGSDGNNCTLTFSGGILTATTCP